MLIVREIKQAFYPECCQPMAAHRLLPPSAFGNQMSDLWSTFWQSLEATNVDVIQQTYAHALPFPFVAIDNFLPLQAVQALEQDCRKVQAIQDASNNFTQNGKVALEDWHAMPESLALACSFFNSGSFLNFLEKITGISSLISDPHLQGGGMHRTERGGFLKMHTDFNWNAQLKLHRRINALFYLNSDYRTDWKGQLLLSSHPARDEISEMEAVEPIANRLVIFNTNDTTFHGHPVPHEFPEGFPRTSLAFYYYTSRPAPRGQRRRFKSTTTRYIPAKGESLSADAASLKTQFGYHVRRWLPFG